MKQTNGKKQNKLILAYIGQADAYKNAIKNGVSCLGSGGQNRSNYTMRMFVYQNAKMFAVCVALRPRPPLPPPRHSAPTYFHCNLSTSLFALLNFSLEKLISIQPDLNHLSLISVTTALKRTPFVIFECIYLYMIYVYTYIYMYIYIIYSKLCT